MSEPTEAGRAWDATVRSAVLDPAVAKMVGADGRQVLLSLVNPDANRDAILAIEREAYEKVRAAVEWMACECVDHANCADCHDDNTNYREALHPVLAAIDTLMEENDGR